MPPKTLALIALVLALLISGCATYKPAPASFQPQIARAQSGTNGPVIAKVSVPSRKEAEKKFGLPLHKKNIQPVWLRLTNTSTYEYYFLPAGLDAEYHPASEVAYMHRKFLAAKRNRRVADDLEAGKLDMLSPPKGTTEGFVFSSHDPGAKHARVDVIGEEEHYRLEFSMPIPGKRIDYQKMDWDAIHPDSDESTDHRVEELREALKAPGFFTHKIDPDTGEARDYLAQEMLVSGSVSKKAWTGGVGAHTPDDPERNLTGDPRWTDGNRIKLFLSREQVAPDKVQMLDWREPDGQ